jgi:hypothetical protein
VFIFPDLVLPSRFLAANPAAFIIFLTLSGVFSLWFLRRVLGYVKNHRERLAFGLIVLAAMGGLLLLAFMVLLYEVVLLNHQGRLRERRNLEIIAWAALYLAAVTAGWAISIQMLAHLAPDFGLSFPTALGKLFAYPKIVQKVIRPIITQGILLEVLLAVSGLLAAAIFLAGKHGQPAGFVGFLLLAGIGATGVGASLYSHVRYFYYLYPLFLILGALFFFLLWTGLRQRNRLLRGLLAAALLLLLAWQADFTWRHVVNALPGKQQPFSGSRVHLDNRECCAYFNENRRPEDYVISFSRVHENAVYCTGVIDACIRPMDGDVALGEYAGARTHYISGSRFFDTDEDFRNLLAREAGPDQAVWLMITRSYLRKGYWEERLVQALADYQVCRGTDGQTSLARISSAELLRLLEDREAGAASDGYPAARNEAAHFSR